MRAGFVVMVRLELRSLAAAMPWLGLVLGACNPTPPRVPNAPEDAGAVDAAVRDGGAGADASPPMANAGTGAPWEFPPIEGKYCALAVGAECDGREDCTSGQRCCARFNAMTFSYDNIRCEGSCRGPTRFEVCHVGGDDGEPDCVEPGYVCRPSLIARFDFVSVCAPRLASEPEIENRGEPGSIACGGESCEVGAEQCCLRATFDFSRPTPQFLPPYCAPLARGRAACGCDVGPQDAGVDAGDASQPDPGEDDAG